MLIERGVVSHPGGDAHAGKALCRTGWRRRLRRPGSQASQWPEPAWSVGPCDAADRPRAARSASRPRVGAPAARPLPGSAQWRRRPGPGWIALRPGSSPPPPTCAPTSVSARSSTTTSVGHSACSPCGQECESPPPNRNVRYSTRSFHRAETGLHRRIRTLVLYGYVVVY